MKQKVLYLLTLLALVLSACTGGAANQPAIARVGWAGSPDTLNPGMAILTEAYTMFELVYDSMYDLNLDGSFKLSLAESATVSDDGIVWTFKIRDGIKWHDGQPLTAEDIAWTYNLYKDTPEYPYLNGYYTTYFDTIEATDNNEVVLTLTEAIPNIESQLVFLYILPKHIWENVDKLEYTNTEMIGSGPFKMTEYVQNEFVHLTANKDYFGGAPKIDEVIFQTFENQDALVQAIKTGQVDMITEMPNTAAESLKSEKDIELVVGAPLAPGVTDIIFNQVDPENCPAEGGLCTGHPALRDRNVRLALAHATDKQNLIDVILLGLGKPGLTLIPDGLGVWYNDSITDYEFDVAKANQILDDAGYIDADGDGIRDMPDGSRPLTFRLNWPSDSIPAPRMAELLAEMWGKVGISLEPQAVDPDALTAQCCPAFDFDIMIWGWASDPDPSSLLYVYTSEGIPTGSSETGYSNPEYDALYAKQQVELNFDARKQLVWDMQKIVHDDVVYIIPFYDANVQAYRTDRFTGWITDQAKVELSDVTSLTVIEPVK
ncbi:MAG TPA: ABC transporter substrate-binding protein [Anaerolineales bacterium]|nr:ABC transporter substrate-binding protein [Anaerolineales bacterium]HNF94005.1 ABC transporter substrate-binding protein [Anaerolineales bacterium]HNH25755.1 ABC transporter substrate-binding protein [Anaerolineales bacterium]